MPCGVCILFAKEYWFQVDTFVFIEDAERDTWLAQLVERETLDLGGESWSPTLGVEIT